MQALKATVSLQPTQACNHTGAARDCDRPRGRVTFVVDRECIAPALSVHLEARSDAACRSSCRADHNRVIAVSPIDDYRHGWIGGAECLIANGDGVEIEAAVKSGIA